MRRHAGKHGWAIGASVLAGMILCLLAAGPSLAARSASRPTLTFAAASASRGANHFLLLRAGRYLQLVDLDTHRVLRQRVFALTAAVSIDGADGHVDNTLTLDFSRGSLAVPAGIAFDGGRGGYNTLNLRGGRFAHQRNVAYGPHSGLIALDDTTIHYADIAPINDTTPATSYTFNVFAPSATVNVVDGEPVLGVQTTQINDGGAGKFERTNIANKTHVSVSGREGSNTFMLNNPHPAQGLETLTLTTDENESSTVDILGTAVPVTVEGQGLDTVTVGAGSLQSILAPLTIKDPKGLLALNVDDSSDATGRTASVTTDGTTDTISGLGPVPITAEVFGLSSLAVSGGTGNNAFTFAGAGQAVSATLNTGAGRDTTNVQATSPEGALAIHGQNGNDAVNIGNGGSVRGVAAAVSVDNALGATTLALDDSADSAARTVTVGPTGVSGLAPGAISYANVPTLTLSGGRPSDTFTVAPSSSTSYTLAGGGAPSAPAPGNTLAMVLTGASAPALSATASSAGVQGAWSFANRRPVTFSGMHSLNPTALSVSDAAATVGGAGLAPLRFTASLLAPSPQPVTVSYATADGTATAASGAYQPASGSIGFAPGTTSQSINVNALGGPAFRPPQTVLLNLTSPVGALLTRATGTGTITDTAPPTVSNARQTHRIWRESNAAVRVSATAARAPVGTTFSFTMSQPASVSFAFTQQLSGRKVRGRCVAPTGSNRHKRSCLRTVTRGTLAFAGRNGANRVSFQGRLSRSQKLRPGRYTLVILATNAGGQRSSPLRLSFTIVR
jgi:hypothetical protein